MGGSVKGEIHMMTKMCSCCGSVNQDKVVLKYKSTIPYNELVFVCTDCYKEHAINGVNINIYKNNSKTKVPVKEEELEQMRAGIQPHFMV